MDMHSLSLRGLASVIERHSFALLLLAVGAYTAFFSIFTVLNHRTYQTYGFDLGIYMQSLWTTINGQGFFYTSLWEGSRFAYHFEPVLLGVLPLYAAFPSGETLLVLQSAALGAGALPVYLFARRRMGRGFGLVCAVLYLLSPAVHAVNGFDFHASALAVPLLLSAHYCLSVGRLRAGVLFALVSLACRENVALIVFLLGAYWAWKWRSDNMLTLNSATLPRDRRFLVATGLCLAAALWFVLAVNVVIPHFAHADTHPAFERYGDALFNLTMNPQAKLLYLVQVFAPLGFLSLLAPGTLLMTVPVFAQNLMSIDESMYHMANQYVALLIPWVFVSAVEGVFLLTSAGHNDAVSLRRRVLATLMAVTFVFSLLYSTSPIALEREFPVVDDHDRVVAQVLSLLPPDAFVFTQNNLFPHVCHRTRAYMTGSRFPIDFFQYDLLYGRIIVERKDGNFDYILMDTVADSSPTRRMPASSWARLRSDYGVYARGDGVFLYKRGYQGEPIEIVRDDPWSPDSVGTGGDD